MRNSYHASAPGKLVLLGEHAVLHGYPAIVCAIDQLMHVTITPRSDQLIKIHSELGEYRTSLQTLSPKKPFEFVLMVLQVLQPQLPSGCDIDIQTDFSHTVGFGSSSAVTIALLKALKQWLKLPLNPQLLFSEAKHIVQQVQGGVGSGIDLIAAIYGGTVYFNPHTGALEQLPHNPPLTVLYSGYKTPTSEVIRQVTLRFAQKPQEFTHLCQSMANLVEIARTAIINADWITLGNQLNEGQKIMRDFGVSNAHLDQCVEQLLHSSGIFGAKISGSGLGDCLVGIGETFTELLNKMPVKIYKKIMP